MNGILAADFAGALIGGGITAVIALLGVAVTYGKLIGSFDALDVRGGKIDARLDAIDSHVEDIRTELTDRMDDLFKEISQARQDVARLEGGIAQGGTTH